MEKIGSLILLHLLLAMWFPIANGRTLIRGGRPPSVNGTGSQNTMRVFREYISGGGAALSDVPVAQTATLTIDFILAFAVDETFFTPHVPTNGNFTAFWQPRLSAAAIQAAKAKHPNARFSLSVGGGVWPVFDPNSTESWIHNAVTSLGAIMASYSINGLDVDYELFESSVDAFVESIGGLIVQLKKQGIIGLASIAPFPDTDEFYTALWQRYNASIDYVNYQFYSQGDMSASEYVTAYESARRMYPGAIVMASFETINNGTSIVPSSAMEGCRLIKNSSTELPGIFIWSADQSYPNFQYEREAQELLLG